MKFIFVIFIIIGCGSKGSQISNSIQDHSDNNNLNDSLLKAIELNDTFLIEKLLNKGADPNYFNSFGNSPLILACSNLDDSRAVSILLEHGANPNIEPPSNVTAKTTPIVVASGARLESVLLLLENGALLKEDVDSMTPLRKALIHNRVEIVLYYVKNNLVDYKSPISVSQDGKNWYITDEMRLWFFPLDSELYKLKLELIEILLENGIDYRNSEIPDRLYKIYSEEYLKVY